jgi:hypothetical protein
MRFVVVGVMSLGLSLGTWSAPARADGGALRLSGVEAGYRISVFTAPTPLRSGAVDFSALVQEARTGEPVSQVRVTFRLARPGGPMLEYPATTEGATNKLFQAARFELPEPGRWDMQVQIEGSHGLAILGCELEAAEPAPRWTEVWPWIGWPALAIVLFLIHPRRFARRPSWSGQAGARGGCVSSCAIHGSTGRQPW